MTARQLLKRGTSTLLFPYRAGLIAMPLFFAASGFALGGVTGFDALTRPSNVSLGVLATCEPFTGKDEALGSATAGPFIPEFRASNLAGPFASQLAEALPGLTSVVPAASATTRVFPSVCQKSNPNCSSCFSGA